MEHKGTQYIETERLILRPFQMDDASAMFENWASDEEVTKFLMWPAHKDISVSKSVLKEWTHNYINKNFYQWAIVFKEYGSKPMGCIGVNNLIDDKIQMAHIGYCIGKKWWHKGIASEALKSVIKYLFEEVKIRRIESTHDTKNHASGAVMKKCGMKYEGTLRQADWNNQGICDACYYAVLIDEYYNKIS